VPLLLIGAMFVAASLVPLLISLRVSVATRFSPPRLQALSMAAQVAIWVLLAVAGVATVLQVSPPIGPPDDDYSGAMTALYVLAVALAGTAGASTSVIFWLSRPRVVAQ
jgi:hypothetical protein